MRGTPREVAERCASWAAEHPTEWAWMRDFVSKTAERGRPIQRDSMYSEAARCSMRVSFEDVFRRDHNLWACLIRYICMLDPTVCRCARLRKSSFDSLDLASIWDEFGPGEPLRARSVKEAMSA